MNYREYAMDPVDLKTVATLQHIIIPILSECAVAESAAHMDDLYDEWVQVWKDNYNQLTEIIRDIRVRPELTQAQQHKVGNYLRRVANTMLNARQFAKDIRRNRRLANIAADLA